MPKKTTRQTKPSADETASDGMAEAERRMGEAHDLEKVAQKLRQRRASNE